MPLFTTAFGSLMSQFGWQTLGLDSQLGQKCERKVQRYWSHTNQICCQTGFKSTLRWDAFSLCTGTASSIMARLAAFSNSSHGPRWKRLSTSVRLQTRLSTWSSSNRKLRLKPCLQDCHHVRGQEVGMHGQSTKSTQTCCTIRLAHQKIRAQPLQWLEECGWHGWVR